jgi:hypothetical protein
MAVDKKIKYDVQGGVKNYLGKQKQVKAPLKWQSSPDHPTTELAYITEAEKNLLIKSDLHGSLKGGVNKGPSGIMSLNGFGSKDSSQNVSGATASAAESGRNTSDTLASGMSNQDVQDFRSAAVASGAGQRVNPGFFDSRNTVSPDVLARAKAFNPAAFGATRGGSLSSFLTSGGILGNIVRGLGQKFGLGKTYNQPTNDMRGIVGSVNPNNFDIYNEFVEDDEDVETITLPNGIIVPKKKPSQQFIEELVPNLANPVEDQVGALDDLYADALTTPTLGDYGLNLKQLNTLKNAGYSNSQIKEVSEKGYAEELVRTIEGPIGGVV